MDSVYFKNQFLHIGLATHTQNTQKKNIYNYSNCKNEIKKKKKISLNIVLVKNFNSNHINYEETFYIIIKVMGMV